MERITWQVKRVSGDDWEDLGDWEPFAMVLGSMYVRKQTMIEDEKSSVHHDLTFNERYGDPED